MKLAIAIFRYFPYGGLQRDMRFTAEEAIKRGHQVSIFCGSWQGEKIPGVDIRIIDKFVWFNIAGVRRFIKAFEQEYDPNKFDLLLGFNKMPGLDAYFAGDTCFAEKAYRKRKWWYRLAARTQLYLQYEAAVFNQQSKTAIFSLVDSAKDIFIQHYATPSKRFFSLPPGIVPKHIACTDPEIARSQLVTRLSITADSKIILCLGSDFRRKGVDLSFNVFAELQKKLPQSRLLVVGQDNSAPYQHQATALGIKDKVFFMGACDAVGELLHAADALLHLAREELAGNVILEAMLCRCPVLVSSVSGYAPYVARYEMGSVIDSIGDAPFVAQQLFDVVTRDKSHWTKLSQAFYLSGEAFSRAPVMLDFLEQIKSEKNNNLEQIEIEDWRNLQISADHDSFFEWVQNIKGEVVRKMPDRETLRFSSGNKSYFLKRHFGVGWKEVIKNLLQCRLPVLGAENEWRALKKLESLSVPALQAVTFGKRGKNPARQQSFIVTDELDNVIQLDHFLEQHSPGYQQKILLVKKVAWIAREMHKAGINHRDFYLCHFMLKQDWSEGEAQLHIIDLHRAQLRNRVPERWLVKDLAALYFSSMSLPVSLKDRLRFLRVYYGQSLKDVYATHEKRLEQIEARAKKLFLKHN